MIALSHLLAMPCGWALLVICTVLVLAVIIASMEGRPK